MSDLVFDTMYAYTSIHMHASRPALFKHLGDQLESETVPAESNRSAEAMTRETTSLLNRGPFAPCFHSNKNGISDDTDTSLLPRLLSL
jgi:hypothetical protein